jgi:ferredoxin
MPEQLASRLHETARITGLPLSSRIQLVTSEQDVDFREKALDRRSFFTSLRSIAFQGVATALAPASRDNPGASYRDKTLPERRTLLLTALHTLPPAEASAVRNAFTFTATFSDACDNCLGCTRACPTAAISEADDGLPTFNQARCTGCRLCMEFCLEGAVTIRS